MGDFYSRHYQKGLDFLMEQSRKSKKSGKRNSPAPKQHVEPDKNDTKTKTRGETKQAMMIRMLTRTDGATLDEMIEVTGWQGHSIRGMMSGVLKKRLGLTISSEKDERGRIYRIAA